MHIKFKKFIIILIFILNANSVYAQTAGSLNLPSASQLTASQLNEAINSVLTNKADSTSPVIQAPLTIQVSKGNSEAPAYISGNTSDEIVNNSNITLPSFYSQLFGGTNHDGISGFTRSIPATTVTAMNGIGGYFN